MAFRAVKLCNCSRNWRFCGHCWKKKDSSCAKCEQSVIIILSFCIFLHRLPLQLTSYCWLVLDLSVTAAALVKQRGVKDIKQGLLWQPPVYCLYVISQSSFSKQLVAPFQKDRSMKRIDNSLNLNQESLLENLFFPHFGSPLDFQLHLLGLGSNATTIVYYLVFSLSYHWSVSSLLSAFGSLCLLPCTHLLNTRKDNTC